MAVISFQGRGAAEILLEKSPIIKICIFYGQTETILFFWTVFNNVFVVLLQS